MQVAVDTGRGPRGTLIVLSGGPGQWGVGLIPLLRGALAPVIEAYRVVVLDQRGTGSSAVNCTPLQKAVGGSDILAPPPKAVRSCALQLGSERGFYTTADTVADLDDLRTALGVRKWTLDGVSYGSFTAEHYALTYPDHVAGLILDSVVPHGGFDAMLRENLRRVAYVLRDVCSEGTTCPSDPAKDLAWVIRHGGDRVGILNALTLDSIVDHSFREVVDVPASLAAARRGDPSGLNEFVDQFRELSALPAQQLSAGLHAATLCSDLRFPWGDSSTALDGRRANLRRAVNDIKKQDVWPFDAASAARHGIIQSCLHWPPTLPAPEPLDTKLPDVPILILHGERDLSTPVGWARREANDAANARLVIVPDAGHSVQFDEGDNPGRDALLRFLLKN